MNCFSHPVCVQQYKDGAAVLNALTVPVQAAENVTLEAEVRRVLKRCGKHREVSKDRAMRTPPACRQWYPSRHYSNDCGVAGLGSGMVLSSQQGYLGHHVTLALHASLPRLQGTYWLTATVVFADVLSSLHVLCFPVMACNIPARCQPSAISRTC